MKKKWGIWSIICTALFVLCSGVLLLMPQKQVYAEENPGKIVFYEINHSGYNGSPLSTYWDRNMIILKNIGGTGVDVSNYSLWSQSSGSKAFSKANVAFNEIGVLNPNEYIVIVHNAGKWNLQESNLPTFIKQSQINNVLISNNLSTNVTKSYLLYKDTTLPDMYKVKGVQATQDNEEFMADQNVSDLVGVGNANSYLYGTQTVEVGQSIRRIADTGNNQTDFEVINNDYISETDNTLAYLIGQVDNTVTIATAKMQEDNTSVSIRAKVTDINGRVLTVQDKGAAILVEVLGSDALVEVAEKDEIVFTGTIVTKNGQKILQVTNDTDSINVRSHGNTLTYFDATLYDLTATHENLNKMISLRAALVENDTSKYIMSNQTRIALTNADTISNGSYWNIKGILRYDGTNWSVDCDENGLMLDGYPYGTLTSVRDMSTSDKDIVVTAYLTYYNGSSFTGTIQDSSAGLGLYFSKYNSDVEIGDYITLVGQRNTHNGNEQLQNVEILYIDKENETPAPNAVEYDYSNPQYDNLVSLGTVDVASVESKKTYTVTYKGQSVRLSFNDNFSLYVGDTIQVNGAIPMHYNQTGTSLNVIANNVNFVKRLNLRVIDVILNSNDSDTVENVRGFVTMIDTTNNYIVIQSEGYGIKVTGVTNINTLSINDVVEVTGVYHIPADDYKYIAATSVVETEKPLDIEDAKRILESEKDGEDFSIIDDSWQSLLATVQEVQVVSVDGNDIVIQDKVNTNPKNTLVVHTTFAHSFDEYDVLTVVGVIGKVNGQQCLIVSSEENIKTHLTTFESVIDRAIVSSVVENAYIRGTITHIEYSTTGSGYISSFTMQDENNVGILVTFESSIPASVRLWDTVTVNGTVNYSKKLNGEVLYLESTSSRITDIVHNSSAVNSTTLTPNQIESDLALNYNGVYVSLDNMKIEGYLTGTSLLKLTNGNFTMYVTNLADMNNLTTLGDVKIGDTVTVTGTLLYTNAGEDTYQYEMVVNENTSTFTNVVKGKISLTFYQNNDAWDKNEPLQVVENITRGTLYTITTGVVQQDGYIFKGWVVVPYNDDSTRYNVGDGIIASDTNMILVGLWVEKYAITFECNGGSEILPIEGEVGTTISAPTTPTREGYKFAGWYSDPDFKHVYVFDTMPDHNVTLYAKWNKDNTTLIIILSVIIGIVVVDAVVMGIVIYRINKKMKIIQGY